MSTELNYKKFRKEASNSKFDFTSSATTSIYITIARVDKKRFCGGGKTGFGSGSLGEQVFVFLLEPAQMLHLSFDLFKLCILDIGRKHHELLEFVPLIFFRVTASDAASTTARLCHIFAASLKRYIQARVRLWGETTWAFLLVLIWLDDSFYEIGLWAGRCFCFWVCSDELGGKRCVLAAHHLKILVSSQVNRLFLLLNWCCVHGERIRLCHLLVHLHLRHHCASWFFKRAHLCLHFRSARLVIIRIQLG